MKKAAYIVSIALIVTLFVPIGTIFAQSKTPDTADTLLASLQPKALKSLLILPPGSTSADLQAAIDNAASEDAISISSDMVFTSTVTAPAGKEITIQSDGDNCWTLHQPLSGLRHFSVSGTLNLVNIILDGKDAAGGVQVNQDGNLVLKDGAIITNCMNTGNGGGISATDGKVIIEGGYITENTSGGSGGGIAAAGSNSSVKLSKGIISKNNSAGSGGGIYATHMMMSGGSIDHNYTNGGSGGGMHTSSSLDMSSGEVSYNEVRPNGVQTTASGGGVYCNGTLGAPVNITGGKIHNNKVGTTSGGSRGGGLCVFRGVKFNMSSGEIYENEATWGGGIFFDAYMQYGTPEENTVITGDTFIHDNQGTQGGGICFYNNVPGNPDTGLLGMAPQINGNVRISENSAAYGGGILFYPYIGTNTPVQIMINGTIGGNAKISGNKVTASGAGVSIQDDNRGKGTIGALTITENATIQENEITTETGNGGGIYASNSNLTLQNKAQISDNAVNNLGGGIYIRTSDFDMSDSKVNGNSAKSGGGIYINNSKLSMKTSLLSDNTAIDGNGGGLYLTDNGEANITEECSLVNNRAPKGGGGGIFTEDTASYANLITDESTQFTGNKAAAAFKPPEGALSLYPEIQFASTSITTHPLNNFDINHLSDPLTFHVTYNANGGNGDYISPALTPDDFYTILEVKETGITRAGYTFTEWNTKSDGNGKTYQPADLVEMAGDITLYAMWKKDEPSSSTTGASSETTGPSNSSNPSSTGNPSGPSQGPDNPETGDDSSWVLFLGLVIAGLLGAATIYKPKKKA